MADWSRYVNKMSKSLGNYIAINEPSDAMFGKLMSISDGLMWRYFELLSFRPLADIAELRAAVQAGRNPRDVKFELASEIVARFHDQGAAERAQAEFIARFRQGGVPEKIETTTIATDGSPQRLANVLKAAGLVSSVSDGNRQIDQGAVRFGTDAAALQKASSRDTELAVPGKYLLQVGKLRFVWAQLAKG